MGYLKEGKELAFLVHSNKKIKKKVIMWYYIGKAIPSKRIKKWIALHVDSLVKTV